MLRLVGGTDVKPVVHPEIRDVVADQVRRVVLEHKVAGATVRGIIMASNPSEYASKDAWLTSMTSFTTGAITLCRMGIILASGGHELGLASDSYATIVDGKLLARRIPELRKMNIDLVGLALY